MCSEPSSGVGSEKERCPPGRRAVSRWAAGRRSHTGTPQERVRLDRAQPSPLHRGAGTGSVRDGSDRSGGASALLRGLVIVATLLTFGLVSTTDARAQSSPTPEGTVITNTATVSFTDANSNSYSDVNDSVNVTVAFQAGVDVIASESSVSPSVGARDTLVFDLANIGNGTDSLTVGETISDASVITIHQYLLTDAGGTTTTYATFAELKAVTDTLDMAQNDTIQVGVDYEVASGKGGESTDYTLDATSQRDGGTSDSDVTSVNSSESIAVSTTPDGGQNLEKLPSNGTNYTETFSVTNDGDGSESFDLLASNTGSAISGIVSVDGVSGDSTRITLSAGASQNVDVIYTVGDVAAGTVDTLTLTARAVTDGTSDDGTADLTVVRPSLSITMEAFEDDQSTDISGGQVLPGDTIQYKVTVTNNGTADATSVSVSETLPSEVTYLSNSDPNSDWSSISESSGTVTADLSGTLASGGGSAFFWVRVEIK